MAPDEPSRRADVMTSHGWLQARKTVLHTCPRKHSTALMPCQRPRALKGRSRTPAFIGSNNMQGRADATLARAHACSLCHARCYHHCKAAAHPHSLTACTRSSPGRPLPPLLPPPPLPPPPPPRQPRCRAAAPRVTPRPAARRASPCQGPFQGPSSSSPPPPPPPRPGSLGRPAACAALASPASRTPAACPAAGSAAA